MQLYVRIRTHSRPLKSYNCKCISSSSQVLYQKNYRLTDVIIQEILFCLWKTKYFKTSTVRLTQNFCNYRSITFLWYRPLGAGLLEATCCRFGAERKWSRVRFPGRKNNPILYIHNDVKLLFALILVIDRLCWFFIVRDSISYSSNCRMLKFEEKLFEIWLTDQARPFQ